MNNLILRNEGSLIRPNQFAESNIEEIVININHEEDNIDVWIDKFIKKKILKSFHNVFIPVVIGPTNSDFLGLRIALHVRTTASHPCQLANIILYSPASLSEIIKYNNLYTLLSTKGVYLIDYSKNAVQSKLDAPRKVNNAIDLKEELRKLDIQVPLNFYDSHSIANFWGAYRLCNIADVKINKIPSLQQNIEKLKDPYFKWLLTINDLSAIRNKEVEEVDKVYRKEIKKFKVLGYNPAIKKR